LKNTVLELQGDVVELKGAVVELFETTAPFFIH